MTFRELIVLSLVVTLVSCQTSSKTEKPEGSGRSRQPQGQSRFIPPFIGYGGFRPGGFFGGGGYPGGYQRPIGYYPGGFGGYYPGANRPGGFYPGGYPGGYYGGYPSQYPRPGYGGFGYPGGNRPFGGLSGAANGFPAATLPGSDNSSSNRPSAVPNLSNLTPSQAALLGQALGASLRPLLAGNGGAGLSGLGGAGAASPLADFLELLG